MVVEMMASDNSPSVNSKIESDGAALVQHPSRRILPETRNPSKSLDRPVLEQTFSTLEQNISELSIRNDLQSGDNHVSTQQDTFMQNEDGDTYLHLCIIHNRIDCINAIQSLLTPEIINMKNNLGQTALHLAVILNQPQVAHFLISRGADLVVQDSEGCTPLHIACKQDEADIQMVEILAGALRPEQTEIVNREGETCMFTAGKHGHIDVVQCLAYHSHDINTQELKAGKTILHVAVEAENVELLEFLLKRTQIELTIVDYMRHEALVLTRYHPVSWETVIRCRPDLERSLIECFYENQSSDDEVSMDEDE